MQLFAEAGSVCGTRRLLVLYGREERAGSPCESPILFACLGPGVGAQGREFPARPPFSWFRLLNTSSGLAHRYPAVSTDSPLCHSVSSSPAEPVAVGAVGGRLSLLWDAVPVSDDPALGGNHTEPPTPSLSSLISNSEMAPSVGKQTEFSCLCLLNASIVTPLCQVKSFLLFSLNQL